MRVATRSVPPVLAPLLIAVAILAYFLGAHRGSSAPAVAARVPTRVISARSVLLEYPTTWSVSATPHSIPGLPIVHPLVLAPGGRAGRAGLISGQFRSGDAGPLPSVLLRAMRAMPATQVVNLLDVQAYRYSGVDLPGFDGSIELYVIPSPGSPPAALACYAAPGSAAEMGECGQIVAKLTLIGQSSFDLTPDTVYAAKLGTLVGTLNRQRLMLRDGINRGTTPAAVAGLARELAARFAAAAARLAALEPPLAAAPEQAALAGSLLHARASYLLLAGAAEASIPAGYETARANVAGAEADVNTGLENFVLLGYNHT